MGRPPAVAWLPHDTATTATPSTAAQSPAPNVAQSVTRANRATSGELPSHPCHVDGRPCEVVESFARPLCSELLQSRRLGKSVVEKLTPTVLRQRFKDAVALVQGDLACRRCRWGEAQARALPGTRLGKHERRILLAATKNASVIAPPDSTRSAAEAQHRAARCLAEAGLVWLGWEEFEKRVRDPRRDHPFWADGKVCVWKDKMRCSTFFRRSIGLTPLGEAVRERFRAELATGRPIRWNDTSALVAAFRWPLAKMVADLKYDATATHARESQGASLAASVGNSSYAIESIRKIETMDKILRAIESVEWRFPPNKEHAPPTVRTAATSRR